MDWVRDRASDPLRILYGVGVVATALLGLALAQGDWVWLVFVVLVVVQLAQKALSGVFLGHRRGMLLSFGFPRVFDVADVYAVELVRPAKYTYLRIWIHDHHRPWPVFGPERWRSYRQAQGLAVRLTTGLNERGGTAGFHDAVSDEWVIAPAQVGNESAG